MVARTLEQRWEESLHQERELREEHHRFLAETPTNLSQADIERIRALSQNISALWHAPDTIAQDRKAIVRCLVDQVMVHVEPRSEYVDVTICWHGGFKSQHQVVRPVCCYSQLRDYDLLIARLKALYQQGKSVPAIAEQLNLEGFTTPSRRNVFSTGTLAPLMKRLGLRGELYRSDLLGPNEWWIRDMATELKIPIHKVYYWATHGWIHARKAPSTKHWILWADDDELKRLEKLKLQRNSYTARHNSELTTPKARKQ